VPLDSAVFCLVAFWGTMPGAVVLSIFWANVLIKGITTLVSIPLIYAVPERRASLAVAGD
jgi:queuosine precursor transporter